MFASLAKAVLHNLGVVLVGLGVAWVGTRIDALLGAGEFKSLAATIAGCALIAGGFFLRAWATFHFYEHRMRVIALAPQAALITSGPYRISRNPLYLGGNVFIFFGAALWFGSPSALVLTAAHLPLVDRFIRREEAQLEQRFGADWLRYKAQVRRWL